MKNGWTGGQYSLYRLIFGAYLAFHFLMLLPWSGELFSSQGVLPNGADSPLLRAFPNLLAICDTPHFVFSLVALSVILSILFAIGFQDRFASVGLWYVGACFLGRNPLIANPALPYAGWLLLAHAFLPSAPYGSWSARGRTDPRGSWTMTPSIYLSAWILMALGYTFSGFMKLSSPSWLDGTALVRVLENPLARPGFIRSWMLSLPVVLLRTASWGALALELSFAPLALVRRARPWIWCAMVSLHVGLFVLVSFPDLTAGMIILHLFTFDPSWVARDDPAASEELFYDGHCGLCQHAVRFVIAEDTGGTAFRFAPLQGETFQRMVTREERKTLPDSVVVMTADGRSLARSEAFLHIFRRLGGFWKVLAIVLSIVPRGLRDFVYDFVARIRFRIFGRREDLCPVMPRELRARFDP
jgi:predicted DCC family thiol-disulfide oxidoreductase YuxK